MRDQYIKNIAWQASLYPDTLPKKFVFVGGDPSLYATDELRLLSEFTDTYHANHTALFRSLDWRSNFISFEKEARHDGNTIMWMRKRYSWREGSYHAGSLPEAMGTFWRDLFNYDRAGEFVLLKDGTVGQIINHYDYMLLSPEYYTFNISTINGDRPIADGDVAFGCKTLDALYSQALMAMGHRLVNIYGITEAEVTKATDAMAASTCDAAAIQSMWQNRVLSFAERDRF